MCPSAFRVSSPPGPGGGGGDQACTKLQNPNGSRERKLCFTKNVQMGDVSSTNYSLVALGPGWL